MSVNFLIEFCLFRSFILNFSSMTQRGRSKYWINVYMYDATSIYKFHWRSPDPVGYELKEKLK